MKELDITHNEANQRIDRFLKKYMSEASTGYLYKMLRKKRIKVNGAKVQPDYILNIGDKIQLYLSEDTMRKFQKKPSLTFAKGQLNIVYEDCNILLLNKPKNLLVHGDNRENVHTLINQVHSYLYLQGDYDPEKENTFAPACCNRLDRNTSGIMIIAKNFPTLQEINKMIKENNVIKKYRALVKGEIKDAKELKGFWVKDSSTNKVEIIHHKTKDAKFIHTKYKPIESNHEYTLLEIDLITGRSHQIRAHLASEGFPIIGDMKYGIRKINRTFYNQYHLNSQFLHAYSLKFQNCPEFLSYLENRMFEAELPKTLLEITQMIFHK